MGPAKILERLELGRRRPLHPSGSLRGRDWGEVGCDPPRRILERLGSATLTIDLWGAQLAETLVVVPSLSGTVIFPAFCARHGPIDKALARTRDDGTNPSATHRELEREAAAQVLFQPSSRRRHLADSGGRQVARLGQAARVRYQTPGPSSMASTATHEELGRGRRDEG